jgi:pterin-4a-carbinolamine dehydratase
MRRFKLLEDWVEQKTPLCEKIPQDSQYRKFLASMDFSNKMESTAYDQIVQDK